MVRATDTTDAFKKLEEFVDRTSRGRDRMIYAKVKGVYCSPVYSNSYGIEASYVNWFNNAITYVAK
nr:MAG TPA: hypothetical protein [Caudoviricetes sp.]